MYVQEKQQSGVETWMVQGSKPYSQIGGQA